MNKVYLVGAGPGDPGLITVKGRAVLARADAVLFDHLAPEALLDFAPAHAERIYVGKKKSVHAYSQEEICEMLIDRARRGMTVVRLKGGDPFVFGRGGEELEALAAAGIPFEVVPGVTSPLGIAAYTGVPLTHRDYTRAVTFVTGHDVGAVDWSKFSHTETLVIFMGIMALRDIARELIAHGRPAATPAMVVRWGTRPDQQTVVGTLGNLADRIDALQLKPPATIVIGDVVGLREKLSWFERLPLFGQRVVITRPAGQAGSFVERLRDLGAEPLETPVIALRPPADSGPLDRAIAGLHTYDWLLFTSANAVRFFLDRLDQSPTDLRALRARICAIGPATRAAVEALHLKVDRMPAEYVAEGVVAALRGESLAGQSILLPRAAAARDVIPLELAKLGAHVDDVETYQTVIPEGAEARVAELFTSGHRPDWITFTSSSTVTNFIKLAGREALANIRLANIRLASIGPVTSRTLRQHGLTVTAEARAFTLDGLIDAMLDWHKNHHPA